MIRITIDDSEVASAVTRLEAQVNAAFGQMRNNLEGLLREAQGKIFALGYSRVSTNIEVELKISDTGGGVAFDLFIPYKAAGGIRLARTYNNPYHGTVAGKFMGQPFQEVLEQQGWEVINFPSGTPISPVRGGAPNTVLKIRPTEAIKQRILSGV
jgi:hypothetical protein